MTAALELDLTPEQLAAATSTASRIVVSAAAGSGKTRVLSARAIWLIAQGVDPERILVLTFTRSACSELRSRIGNAGVQIETLHSFAWRMLDRPQLATYHEAQAGVRSLYEGSMRRKDRELPGIEELRAAISRYEAGEPVDEVALHFVLIVLARLRDSGLVPLWDLLPRLLATTHGGSDVDVADHILVDEWQDVSRNERLLPWRAHRAGMFAVGDPAQSIFGWRHGRWHDVEDAEVYRLSRSFRFGPAIAAKANEIGERFGAQPVEGDPDNHDSVVTIPRVDLRLEVEADPASTLILARTNRECEAIEREVGGLAVHARRNPRDPLSSESDRFADIWAGGRAVISTVHASKSREADRVIYVRDMDGERENDEERRVDYVAVTRAKMRLVIVRSEFSSEK